MIRGFSLIDWPRLVCVPGAPFLSCRRRGEWRHLSLKARKKITDNRKAIKSIFLDWIQARNHTFWPPNVNARIILAARTRLRTPSPLALALPGPAARHGFEGQRRRGQKRAVLSTLTRLLLKTTWTVLSTLLMHLQIQIAIQIAIQIRTET